MGLPLLIALVGEKAAVPAILAMLTDMVLIQTPTMALLEVARNRDGHPLATAGKVLKGFAANPLVLAVAVAAAVAATEIPVPVTVDAFTRILGQAAGPCALFAIGAKLAGQPVGRPVQRGRADDRGQAAPPSRRRLGQHGVAVRHGCGTRDDRRAAGGPADRR